MNATQQRRFNFYRSMERLGFSFDEANRLRRIELTLSSWSAAECGDGNDFASWAIERDEATGVPYRVTYPHKGPSRRQRIPDREGGALKRLATIMESHPKYWSYHQTDPRGCSLYIVSKAYTCFDNLASNYTHGFPVCF